MNDSDTSRDERSRQRDRATAYHEAGHAVMAMVLGRPVHKVTIVAGKIQTGGTRLGACQVQKGRFKPTKDSLEDEVLILLAGMVAEAKLTGQYSREGAVQDLRVVRRLLATRESRESQLERLERRMLSKTEHILADEAHIEAIQVIARELELHATLSGRAVRHHFEQAIQKYQP